MATRRNRQEIEKAEHVEANDAKRVQLSDNSGNDISSTNPLPVAIDEVTIQNAQLNVNLDESDDSVLVYGNDGTNNQAIKTDTDGHLQVDIVSGTINSTETSIVETFGTSTSLATTSTDTLVSYTATTGDKLKGFYGTSERAGIFWIEINGVKKFSQIVTSDSPFFNFDFPGPRDLSNGDTVDLKVTNLGLASTDYEGGIFIE